MIRKILSFLIFFSFLTSFTIMFSIDSVSQGDGTTYTVWLPTDPQINTDRAEFNYTLWEDSINDANNVGVNISFVIGDCINGYPGYTSPTWSECIWAWAKFYEYYDTLNADIFSDITIGNHDIMPGYNEYTNNHSWKNHTRINATLYPYGNYTYEWGNIIFVILATEYQDGVGDGWYTNQTTWLNTVVTTNSDKNIFVLCHHPLGTGQMDSASDTSITNTITNNDNVIAFFYGHTHSGTGTIITYGSCKHVNCNTVNGYVKKSIFLSIQDGNATVDVRAYNHVTNAFISINNVPTTLTLKYNFTLDEEEEEEICFNSINGEANESIVNVRQRYFNWTKIDGATKYQLRVSNETSFATTFINFSNISEGCDFEYMPGGNYTEVGDYVEFYLPYQYNISWYGYHYYQVRSYTT